MLISPCIRTMTVPDCDRPGAEVVRRDVLDVDHARPLIEGDGPARAAGQREGWPVAASVIVAGVVANAGVE